MTTTASTTTASIPTGLKELIAACEAEVEGFKYSFQKKPELTAMLTQARAEQPPLKVAKKDDKKSSKKVSKKVVEENVEGIELPDPDDVEEEYIGELEEVLEEEEKPNKPSKSKKAQSQDKVEDVEVNEVEEVEEPKKSKKGKRHVKPEDDIKFVIKRPDVIAIANNAEYSTSDKIRQLFRKSKVSVGNISKVLGIHYSFAYCVVDAFRKLSSDSKSDKAVKA